MKKVMITAAFLASALFTGAVSAQTPSFYVVTNKAEANTIVGYAKNESGNYEFVGEYHTGGKGTGDLEIPALQKDETHPLANGDDPLISANAIAADAGGKNVIVVNPGDATLSLLAVNGDLSLTVVNTVPASDPFPVSVAIARGLVVAASVGDNNGAGSISAYRVVSGKLEPVAGSRRDLKARPSTIAFSSDGRHVVVDELVTGKIRIFAVEDGNLSAEPVSSIDSPRATQDRFQAIPVGFAIRNDGNNDVVLVSEARFLTPDFILRQDKNKVPQSPLYSWQTGSLSTYLLNEEGNISLLSGDVLTGNAVEGGEIANCWVALSKDGKHLYAANALSSSISRFDIDDQGHAFLDNVAAFKDAGEGLFFSDLQVSRDGTELYQLVGNKGQVMIFSITEEGDLSLVQTINGLPELGTYGMLVF